MANYMAMVLEAAGVKTTVWQKVDSGSQITVTSQTVSYVDANGREVDLPETYEMSVINGVDRNIPGVV